MTFTDTNSKGISPFFVAFVAAPVAADASTWIAAYRYSIRKTPKSISIGEELGVM